MKVNLMGFNVAGGQQSGRDRVLTKGWGARLWRRKEQPVFLLFISHSAGRDKAH